MHKGDVEGAKKTEAKESVHGLRKAAYRSGLTDKWN